MCGVNNGNSYADVATLNKAKIKEDSFIRKHWEGLLMLFFTLVATFAAIHSCNKSETANEIAKKALDISEQQFLQTNKPFLTLKPTKYRSIDRFVKLNRNKNVVNVEIQFKLANIGNVAASKIHTPDKVEIPNAKIKEIALLPNLSLGPGDHVFIGWKVVMFKESDSDAIDFISKFEHDGDIEPIEVGLPIIYESELDSNMQHKLVSIFQISKGKVRIIKSEIVSKVISKERDEDD